MPVSQPPLDVLPRTMLLVGNDTGGSSSVPRQNHVYPATGTATKTVLLGGPAEIDRAVAAARTALPSWKALPANQRRELMLRLSRLIAENAGPLAALQTIESGMPCRLAAHLPANAADYLAYYAGWADKTGGDVVPTWPSPALDYTLSEPYGVLAAIVPWNAALMSLAQVLGAALAAGNTVVVKPSELAPFTSLRVGELLLEAGFPAGVVNVVPGGPAAGAALVRHSGIDKIHFTGSGATARQVLHAAGENLTPVSLELGGKSPVLIFADCDLADAVKHALSGVITLSGQGCTNGTRVLVEASVYDRVLTLARGMLRRIAIGDPLDEQTVMGPVVSATACSRILQIIDRARLSGHGTLLCGGERLGGDLAGGFFVAPTLFADVDSGSELAQEEIFGPVVCFMRFADDEEAIRLANSTRYGLAAYVYTNNLRRAHRLSAELAAGSVWVNGLEGVGPSTPFGGIKQSGYGRLGGRSGIQEFTRVKNVWISLRP
jgi:acyl-CoA reductase-like NAD-dependent aldehyde dehydrogenase